MPEINTQSVKTTCPYCGVGCGVAVCNVQSESADVTGDAEHPANHGKLCLKGQSLGETLSLEGRLLEPMVDGANASWDDALDRIAQKFKHCLDNYGPESIAFYVSGQLLTEDYYAANKFVKGFLGTANLDTNSRLCMASSVAGHKRAFGTDTVPGCYEDLELADLVILVGSNLAWCHPVLFQRIDAARQNNKNMRIINIDPRRTATAEMSDTHLNIKPDSDTALFCGLLDWLKNQKLADEKFIAAATNGLDSILEYAQSYNVTTVATLTGLSEDQVISFYQSFASTKKVVTVYSQGVNQSAGGTDKVNSIINCHLYTGRIGKPGSGPFSVTGQPNAMGGRETGGLANTLACHMELGNPEHQKIVQSYWQSPHIAKEPGLTAVNLFNAIDQGKVRAIWIMATNPLVSMPDVNFAEQALKKCDFVVQSDVVMINDTAKHAHVRLPAQAWGEKDGTVTNSERCISRQRRFQKPPEHTRPDWWAVSKVASRLGFSDAFDYQQPSEIFAEYAELSGTANEGKRDFDISVYSDITADTYSNLEPFYWPAKTCAPTTPIRFFGNGSFYTDDGRARFVTPETVKPEKGEENTLHLNSGRVRDHWHTMTRTGSAPTLSSHSAEPFIEIHPQNATQRNLKDADIALVSNGYGTCNARVVVTDRVAPHSVFMPMHWCTPFASAGRVNTLTERLTDPISHQPALKNARVQISRLACVLFGFTVSREPINTDTLHYYSMARCDGGWRCEFALTDACDMEVLLTTIFRKQGAETIVYKDNDRARHFSFDGESLITACAVDAHPVAASRNWLASLLTQKHKLSTRSSLLAGFKPDNGEDIGEVVCTCMAVGSKQIESAVTQHGCKTINEVGDCTGAGTNCGSCRGEITLILKRLTLEKVA